MSEQSNELSIAIQKISDHFEFQKKVTKWSLWVILIMLVVVVVGSVFASFYLDSRMGDLAGSGKEPYDWYDARVAARKGEFEKALKISDELVVSRPLDFDVHYYRGELLILMGDREGALKSFQKAAEIFPIPRHTDAVKALSP